MNVSTSGATGPPEWFGALQKIGSKISPSPKTKAKTCEKTSAVFQQCKPNLSSAWRVYKGEASEEDKIKSKKLGTRVSTITCAILATALTVAFVAACVFASATPPGLVALTTWTVIGATAALLGAGAFTSFAAYFHKNAGCQEQFLETFKKERLPCLNFQDFENKLKNNYAIDQTSKSTQKIPWDPKKKTGLIVRFSDDAKDAQERNVSWTERKNQLALFPSHNLVECVVKDERELGIILKELEEITQKKVDYLQIDTPQTKLQERLFEKHSLIKEKLSRNAKLVFEQPVPHENLQKFSEKMGEKREIFAPQKELLEYQSPLEIQRVEKKGFSVQSHKIFSHPFSVEDNVYKGGKVFKRKRSPRFLTWGKSDTLEGLGTITAASTLLDKGVLKAGSRSWFETYKETISKEVDIPASSKSVILEKLGSYPEEEAARFAAQIEGLRNVEDSAQREALLIQHIQLRMAQCSYERDSIDGPGDYHNTPGETLTDGGQKIDYEDYAILAHFYGEVAKDCGVVSEDMNFEVVSGNVLNEDGAEGSGHAWTRVTLSNGDTFDIDRAYSSARGYDELIPASETTHITKYTMQIDEERYTDSEGWLRYPHTDRVEGDLTNTVAVDDYQKLRDEDIPILENSEDTVELTTGTIPAYTELQKSQVERTKLVDESFKDNWQFESVFSGLFTGIGALFSTAVSSAKSLRVLQAERRAQKIKTLFFNREEPQAFKFLKDHCSYLDLKKVGNSENGSKIQSMIVLMQHCSKKGKISDLEKHLKHLGIDLESVKERAIRSDKEEVELSTKKLLKALEEKQAKLKLAVIKALKEQKNELKKIKELLEKTSKARGKDVYKKFQVNAVATLLFPFAVLGIADAVRTAAYELTRQKNKKKITCLETKETKLSNLSIRQDKAKELLEKSQDFLAKKKKRLKIKEGAALANEAIHVGSGAFSITFFFTGVGSLAKSIACGICKVGAGVGQGIALSKAGRAKAADLFEEIKSVYMLDSTNTALRSELATLASTLFSLSQDQATTLLNTSDIDKAFFSVNRS